MEDDNKECKEAKDESLSRRCQKTKENDEDEEEGLVKGGEGKADSWIGLKGREEFFLFLDGWHNWM